MHERLKKGVTQHTGVDWVAYPQALHELNVHSAALLPLCLIGESLTVNSSGGIRDRQSLPLPSAHFERPRARTLQSCCGTVKTTCQSAPFVGLRSTFRSTSRTARIRNISWSHWPLRIANASLRATWSPTGAPWPWLSCCSRRRSSPAQVRTFHLCLRLKTAWAVRRLCQPVPTCVSFSGIQFLLAAFSARNAIPGTTKGPRVREVCLREMARLDWHWFPRLRGWATPSLPVCGSVDSGVMCTCSEGSAEGAGRNELTCCSRRSTVQRGQSSRSSGLPYGWWNGFRCLWAWWFLVVRRRGGCAIRADGSPPLQSSTPPWWGHVPAMHPPRRYTCSSLTSK